MTNPDIPKSAVPEGELRAEAKRLLRTQRAGTLATLDKDGLPFASLITVATLPDASIILLLSQLSAHTRHVQADPRCSILLAQVGRGDPLAHPRLTLVGQSAPVEAEVVPQARRRFLSRNPKSELYVDFPDFAFWRFVPTVGHLNGGFARAATFSGEQILTRTEGCEGLIEGEDGAAAHMNADHGDAVKLYATRLLGLPDREWRVSGLDPEGLDLVSGDLTGRLPFPQPVSSGAELRQVLVSLATEARARPTEDRGRAVASGA